MTWSSGEAPALHVLHARVIWLWRITGVAQVLIAIALSAAASVFFLETPPPGTFWIILGVAGVLAAWGGAYLRYVAWGFDVEASDLRVRRGVLVRTTSVIPLARIQHVDTQQDVLERWLGLASLVVYTAGVRGAEIAVPGLAIADAESIRDRLAAIAGAADRAV